MDFLNLLVTIFVLTSIASIVYCKAMNKTLVELFKEIKEILKGGSNE